MSSEDAAAQDIGDPWRLLAAALRSVEVSRRRANDEATKAGRWRDARDEFAAAARAALGMGPLPPHNVHTGPILARIGEVVAERDRALAELERAEADLALSERRRADATKGANATAAALESLRATQRKERRSIAAREGAVERRVRAVERAAEERVARASAAVTAAREEAQQQAAWTEAQLGALRAELEAARAELKAARTEVAAARKRADKVQAVPAVPAAATKPATPAKVVPIALTEQEQAAAAERLSRAPRVVAALRGADVAALLRSGSPVAVALGRVSLGAPSVDRAGLLLAMAQAWAKGVR